MASEPKENISEERFEVARGCSRQYQRLFNLHGLNKALRGNLNSNNHNPLCQSNKEVHIL